MDPNLFGFDCFAPSSDDQFLFNSLGNAQHQQAGLWDSSLPTNTTSMALAGTNYVPSFTSQTALPTRPISRIHEGHERKRVKVESTTFEPVDYWLDLGGDKVESDDGALDQSLANAPNLLSNNANNLSRQSHDPMNNPIATPAGGIVSGGSYFTGARPSASRGGPSKSTTTSTLPENDESFSMNLVDQLTAIDTVPPLDVSPRDGLYSTPMSWEKTQPGFELDMDQFMDFNAAALDPDEQQRLMTIAMNTAPTTAGTGAGVGGGADVGDLGINIAPSFAPRFAAQGLFGMSSALLSPRAVSDHQHHVPPTPTASSKSTIAPSVALADASTVVAGATSTAKPTAVRPATLGRRVSGQLRATATVPGGSVDDKATTVFSKEKPPPGTKSDRAAHNDIERKYRTNLKDKIAELRDSVPCLRSVAVENCASDEAAEGSPAGAGAGAAASCGTGTSTSTGTGAGTGTGTGSRVPKVSKGTVLTKATEYIHFLERKNKAIMREHNDLSRKLQAYEQLLNASAHATMPNYSRALFDPRGFC